MDMTKLKKKLTSTGFTEVEILGRSPRKQNTAVWFFKARRSDHRVQIPVQLGEAESAVLLSASREYKQKQPSKEPMKLKRERGTSFAFVVRNSHFKPGLVSTDTATEPEAVEPQKMETQREDEDAKMEGQPKRAAPQAASEKSAKQRKAIPLPSGSQVIPNKGGGNCLFHSLASACSWIESKDRSHRQIRAALVAAMRKHSTIFEHVWDQRMPDDSRTVKPFSEYLDALEKEEDPGEDSSRSMHSLRCKSSMSWSLMLTSTKHSDLKAETTHPHM